MHLTVLLGFSGLNLGAQSLLPPRHLRHAAASSNLARLTDRPNGWMWASFLESFPPKDGVFRLRFPQKYGKTSLVCCENRLIACNLDHSMWLLMSRFSWHQLWKRMPFRETAWRRHGAPSIGLCFAEKIMSDFAIQHFFFSSSYDMSNIIFD